MNYSVVVTAFFEKQLKRLTKKYPSLKFEFIQLVTSLKENPEQGTTIGNHCFKIRLAISSKGKGKSGGARVITHIQVVNQKVYLLSIYDKSEQDSISEYEIKEIIKGISI